MQTDRENLLNVLKELSYEEREITLSSGKKSNFYIDVRNTSLHPKGIVLCGRELLRVLRSEGPHFDAVAGPSLGADPLVSGILYAGHQKGDNIAGMLVRKEAKGHGTGRLLEGTRNVPVGSKIAVIEDVLTTGKSSLRTIRAIRDAGYDPVRLIVVVDRQEGGCQAVENEEGIPVIALYRKCDFGSGEIA